MSQPQPPERLCPVCRQQRWWLNPGGQWTCGVCHPDPANFDFEAERAAALKRRLASQSRFGRLHYSDDGH